MLLAAAPAATYADEATFWADGYPAAVDLTGETDQVLEVSGFGTLKCLQEGGSSAHATATLSEEGPELTAEGIAYTSCVAFGVLPATVDMNGCEVSFTAGEPTEAEGESLGSAAIDGCESETGISIAIFSSEDPEHKTPICAVDIPEQEPTGGAVRYKNVANGDITLTAEELVLHSQVTEVGICAAEEGSATYDGALLASGTDAEEEATDIAIGELLHETPHGDADFSADRYPAILDLTGETDVVFASPIGEFSCTQLEESPAITGQAILAEESPVLTAEEVSYANCHMSEIFPITIDMNGCDYRLLAGEMVSESEAVGSLEIDGCEAETGISMTVFDIEKSSVICTMDMPEQAASSGSLGFANLGGGDITIEAEDIVFDTHVTEGGICSKEEIQIGSSFAFLAQGTNEAEEPTDIEVTGTE